MGIFSKMIDYVTGGSAEVELSVDNANLGQAFPIKITANIKRDDLHASKVYLLVKCVEKKLEGFKPEDEKNMTDNEKILSEMRDWISETIYKNEIQVAPAVVLEKGKSYDWVVNLDLSQNTKPSMDTKEHKIIWQLWAGIDVPGNDPDSGWTTIEVNP